MSEMLSSPKMNVSRPDKYATAKADRKRFVDAVLESQAKKNLVVGGPGTGKTYLFRALLEGMHDALTLTFVNTLVDDLSLELCGLCDVKTLHGFARSQLAIATKDTVEIFPRLSEVIREDAVILLGNDLDFDSLFHERDDQNDNIDFYRKRKDYYGKFYGYSDIVFAIVKYFEQHRDKIPHYEQIVVDEFQDFNKLEVSLIDLLAEKSPILIVGDDDQALYGFKKASPTHLRTRHAKASEEFASFTLPYCSRCTRVIVGATNDVIQGAIKNGNLVDRIPKDFRYFDDRRKDKECDTYPNIKYGKVHQTQIPWFIEGEIKEIMRQERHSFNVLIISPTRTQVRAIASGLRGKGFENIDLVQKEQRGGIPLLEGLKILLEDKESNLGWRIVAKSILSGDEFSQLVKATDQETGKTVIGLMRTDSKREIKKLLTSLRALKKNEQLSADELSAALEMIGIDPFKLAKEALLTEITGGRHRGGNRAIKRVRIKVTTVQGSKGLSADYVFIVNFDDKYWISDRDKTKVADQDVCNMVVALTRAKKSVVLLSAKTDRDPLFLQWIDKSRIQEVV